MKRYIIAAAALLAGISLSAQIRFSNTPSNKKANYDLEMNLQKIVMASVMINNFYVDSVDSKKLAEDAINGILMKLDPHSAYTNASDTKKFTEPLEGSFEGIGVQFNILEDTLLVIQPVPKGPSERVGILAGDRIVSVADTAIAGVKMSREEIMHRLRGPKGTIAHLGIVRRGIRDTLYFDVKRDRIPVNSVDAAYMITPTIGLIRFNNFAQTTHGEVVEAIKKLKKEGMKDLIIDLQQNSGGFLQAAADIASEFLPKGDMIVYTKGRSVPSQEFRSSGGAAFQEGRVAVLIDEYSASASEILSGAIQDHPKRTKHTETIRKRKRTRLRTRRHQPLQQGRTDQRRQHPLPRLPPLPNTQERAHSIWRRRHHARLLRAARHNPLRQMLSRNVRQKHHHQRKPAIHGQESQKTG